MGFLATAAIVGGLATAGATVYSAQSQANATKKAANAASAQNAAAIQNAKDAQSAASTQAQNAITSKARAVGASQSIYTSPLGLTTQASTVKKTLLGQ